MIPILPTRSTFCSDLVAFRAAKSTLLLLLMSCVLTCVSCSESKPAPPRDTVTDTAPVGEGLKVIGFAVLGAAVVGVLGRMLK